MDISRDIQKEFLGDIRYDAFYDKKKFLKMEKKECKNFRKRSKKRRNVVLISLLFNA